jgi:hypothetical protein
VELGNVADGRLDTRLHERAGHVLDFGDARREQVVLAREVIADHAGAGQAGVLRDPAEGRAGVADISHHFDRRGHDLGPTTRLRERSCSYEQTLLTQARLSPANQV